MIEPDVKTGNRKSLRPETMAGIGDGGPHGKGTAVYARGGIR